MKGGVSTDGDDAIELGFAPNPKNVHQWFLSHGLIPERVGSTLLGRDLFVYHYRHRNAVDDTPTLLFLSLVHGNEVFGLISLLQTAETLFYESRPSSPEVNLIFFPIVNLDGYLLNRLHLAGCRRTNLRHTCQMLPANRTNKCGGRFPVNDGVDLNRNFVHDKWSQHHSLDFVQYCLTMSPGSEGFSEPETQAVRNVVKSSPHLVAALSYHTRATSTRPPLLIHPFASGRSMDEMPLDRLVQYHKYSDMLVASLPMRLRCKAGTASETIGYNATGTTMDWLEAQGIFAWVHEISLPCKGRWCGPVEYDINYPDLSEYHHNRNDPCVQSVMDTGRGNAQLGIELTKIFGRTNISERRRDFDFFPMANRPNCVPLSSPARLQRSQTEPFIHFNDASLFRSQIETLFFLQMVLVVIAAFLSIYTIIRSSSSSFTPNLCRTGRDRNY